MAVFLLAVAQVDELDALVRQVRRTGILALRLVLEFLQPICAAEGLLTSGDLALLGSNYGAELNQSAELGRHLCLIDAFDVLVEQVLCKKTAR